MARFLAVNWAVVWMVVAATSVAAADLSQAEVTRLTKAIEAQTADTLKTFEKVVAEIEESGQEPEPGAMDRASAMVDYINSGGFLLPWLDPYDTGDSIGNIPGHFEIRFIVGGVATVDLSDFYSAAKPEATFKRIKVKGLTREDHTMPPLSKSGNNYEVLPLDNLRRQLPAKYRNLK